MSFRPAEMGGAEMSSRCLTSLRIWQLTVAVCVCATTGDALLAAGYPQVRGQRPGTLAAHFQTRPDSPFAAVQANYQAGGYPCVPQASCAPSTPYTAPETPPQPLSNTAPPAAPQYNFSNAPSGLVPSARTVAANGGYIDPAIVETQLRFRYDSAYGFNRADRAEYFYSTWTVFGGKTPPRDMGPNDNIDAQFFKLYYEQLVMDDLSLFIEAPIILNNPSGVPGPGPNTSGFGDLNAGFKWALYETDTTILTFQLKNYIAVGDPDKWLTAGHASIEPGLLFLTQPADRWTIEAELKDWIPIQGGVNPRNGRDFAGNVLSYGIGAAYAVVDNSSLSVAPVAEFVGWSVLDGQKTDYASSGRLIGPVDASGDTIVNGKFGVRIGFGKDTCDPTKQRDSIYIGYGRALTGERWYQDILRAEYRMFF
ncbi:hypothetical protein Mal52_19760 [Symmachiella dynata]|uniref:Uncharacterized protein n=2 Tax=Symmachiella dynata TaxID=2527995 RepID=A0A517ZM00_9PLAN|nr:hypothetical protein Mal52_19760 [Symmachiella dynata]